MAMHEETRRLNVELFADIFTDLDQITTTLTAGAGIQIVTMFNPGQFRRQSIAAGAFVWAWCAGGWRISNSMEAVFCVDCLEDALRHHGTPEIFNSDQGAQFTSTAFTDVLKRQGVVISMDGRGRAFDNIFVERLWRSVKHEDVYLKGYQEGLSRVSFPLGK
jgi:transposase InsO family protein